MFAALAVGPRVRACDLSGGNVETVEDVGRGDRKDQSRQRRLLVMTCGLVPDVVGNRIRPVAEPGNGLGERQRGAFGVGKIGRFSPGRHREEAIVCFTHLLGFTSATVNAEAAAIDLANAQVNKSERLRRHLPFLRRCIQSLYRLHCVRNDHRWVFHSRLHGFHDVFPLSFQCFRRAGNVSRLHNDDVRKHPTSTFGQSFLVPREQRPRHWKSRVVEPKTGGGHKSHLSHWSHPTRKRKRRQGCLQNRKQKTETRNRRTASEGSVKNAPSNRFLIRLLMCPDFWHSSPRFRRAASLYPE